MSNGISVLESRVFVDAFFFFLLFFPLAEKEPCGKDEHESSQESPFLSVIEQGFKTTYTL